VKKIPHELQVQPELRVGAEDLLEPQCGVRGDPPLAVDDLIQPRVGNPNPLGQFGLTDFERFDELLQEDLSGMSRNPIFWKPHTNDRVLVIVNYLDIYGALVSPPEANAILVVDTDAVLSCSVPFEGLQAIPWRKPQVGEHRCRVQDVEFATRNRPDAVRTSAPRRATVCTVENVCRALTGE
jgi:hypothetical protein